MTLRRHLVLYVSAVSSVVAALAAFLLWQYPLWLIPVEAAAAALLAWGVWLARAFTRASSLADESVQLLTDGDLMTRLRPSGHAEVDTLIGLYNRMVDALRDERTRLQEQHFFLSRVLEVSPSAIVTFDFDGRFDYVNAAAERLFGEPAGRLAGRRPGDIAGSLAAALPRLEAGRSRVVVLEGARRVRCHRGAFINRGFSRSFVLVEELTEEFREVEKAAYEKLIRMLSHEVNNTVAASTSLLSSCLAYAPQIGERDRADFETALGVVVARATELNTFMRGFADVVRLPAPRPAPCDLADLVRGVGRLAEPLGAVRRVEWRWNVPKQAVPVAVDRAQLEQALLNILKNAAEAVPEGGRVTVSIGRDAGRPWLSVEDNGPGIPETVRDQLFTPFFSTKPGGQGLGLTLVQEILRQHDLPFTLDSRPGGPTRFTIRFLPSPASD